jgi:hypothetical protein
MNAVKSFIVEAFGLLNNLFFHAYEQNIFLPNGL